MARKKKDTTITQPQLPAPAKHGPGFIWMDDDDYEDQLVEELVDACNLINRKEAATYIGHAAKLLKSFKPSYSLLEVFKWYEAPQGYGFWEEVYMELVEVQYQLPYEKECLYYEVKLNPSVGSKPKVTAKTQAVKKV